MSAMDSQRTLAAADSYRVEKSSSSAFTEHLGIDIEEQDRTLTDTKVLASQSYLKSVQSFLAPSRLKQSTSRFFDSAPTTPRYPASGAASSGSAFSSGFSGEAKLSAQRSTSSGAVQPSANAGTNLLIEAGLFEAAQIANPVLPQYHPTMLLELLNFGKVKRVTALLAHLCRTIAGSESFDNAELDQLIEQHEVRGDDDDAYDEDADEFGNAGRARQSKSLSEIGRRKSIEPSALGLSASSDGGLIVIPPLPVHTLLALDEGAVEDMGASKSAAQSQAYDDLLSTDAALATSGDDPFDSTDVFGTSPNSRKIFELRKRRASMVERSNTAGGIGNLSNFSAAHARLLAEHLTRTQLPGLSSLDQMYLVALARTVAGVKGDADGLAEQPTGAVDACGLRFMLAVQQHTYLLRALPIHQRLHLQQTGLSADNVVWAFHSESQEELLNAIPSVAKGTPSWAELRQFGVGWWLRSITLLRQVQWHVPKLAD